MITLKNKFIQLLICLSLYALLSACSITSLNPPISTATHAATLTPLPPTKTAAPTRTPTVTVTRSPTPSLTPTLTPTATVTPTPSPMSGTIVGAEVNFREGPSRLFPVIRKLHYGDPIEVFGAAPGREWVQIRTAGGEIGWVTSEFVQTELTRESLPIIPISDVWLTVKGLVKDNSGKPVFGAHLVLYDNAHTSTESQSWEDGLFYLYLPNDQQGQWNLSIVGVECTNVLTNPICRQAGRFIDNPRMIDLHGNLTVEFVYQ